MQIYIHRDGQQTGPYSLDDLKAHLDSGALQPTDLAWYEGAADWSPISSIPGVSTTSNTLRVSSRQEQTREDTFEELESEEPKPEKRTQKKWLLNIVALAAMFFALVFLVGTLSMITGSKHDGLPWGILLGGLFLCILSVSICVQCMIALRCGPPSGVCDHCNKTKPTISAGINRHIGAIILFFHKSATGQMCKQCISNVFWQYTLITLFFGWWGAMSLFVTPFVLTNNAVVYIRSLMMKNRN